MSMLPWARTRDADPTKHPSAPAQSHQSGGHGPGQDGGHGGHIAAAEGTIDPVCGMQVDPHETTYRHAHQGRTYYFCSAGCQAKFAAEPAKYLGSETGKSAPAPVPEGTIYTCPMHPEIRQPGPGNCPICGMALEPVLASAGTGPNPELVDMTRRFLIGLGLSVPGVALQNARPLSHLPLRRGRTRANWFTTLDP